MPGKRSNRKNVHHFRCPHCDSRLWRSGSPKHFLYYTGAVEIQQHVNMPRQSAVLLAAKGVYVDRNCWIEDFTCGQHGKMWMKITKKTDGSLIAVLATSRDWQRTTHTIQPETPNPSVGEYTYKMSRQASTKLSYTRE